MKKTVLLLPTLLLAMTGCGSHSDGGKGATQVVAKVNDKEITVHQLNLATSKLGKLDQSQFKKASEKVLQDLIDLQLLQQKSLEAKLDRDPNVLQVLEASKQQVLAQAYMQKIAAKQTAPNDSEITQFYNQHPELFSERNVYILHEFQVKDGQQHVSEIEAGINAAKTPEEVADWLKRNNYLFNVNANKRAAEQLPLDIAKKLGTLKTGDSLLIKSQEGLNILFVTKSERQPVELAKAKQVITQFLVNSGQQNLIKNELAELRKQAKIELLGEFANSKASTPEVETAKTPEKNQDATASESNSSDKKAIEKGLSGLK